MNPALIEAPAALSALEPLVDRFRGDDMDVPGGAARIRVGVSEVGELDAVIEDSTLRLEEPTAAASPTPGSRPTRATWAAIADDVRGGMDAFRSRPAAASAATSTSGSACSPRPAARRSRAGCASAGCAPASHEISTAEAGEGPPLICLHGLGGTKASFLTTVSALAPAGDRVIAIDLPGFGDSDKPHAAPFDAPWFAEVVVELLDELGLERASFAGNSMGGRIALELGMSHPERVDRLVLLAPSLAWLKERPWKWLLQMPLPRLGYLQPTPRWMVEPIVRRLVPGGERRLDGRRGRRVPARLLHARGPVRLLRVRAQHLHGRALRRARASGPG